MEKGIILLINGPGSAGKTTLSWKLQDKAPGYWYWLPIDHFFDMIPSQQWERDREESFRIAYDFHHDCVRVLSDQGKNVIVDTVICSEDKLVSFVNKLSEHTVIMVKATCPLEELNRREIARGDREIGLAANQTDKVIPKDDYDLVVDTHAQTTDECARYIMDLSVNHQSINAFKKLTLKIKL